MQPSDSGRSPNRSFDDHVPQPYNSNWRTTQQNTMTEAEAYCLNKHPGIDQCMSIFSNADPKSCKALVNEHQACLRDTLMQMLNDKGYWNSKKSKGWR